MIYIDATISITIRITGKNLEHREIFTQRKNIGDSGGTVRGKTCCWLRMTYELLPVERIFHAKQNKIAGRRR